MKMRIACDDLANMLGRLQGFLFSARNSLLQVCSNVHLRVEESGDLHLSATDLQISFHGTLKVKDQEPGETLVDGKRLYAMVKQLPAEEVLIELKDSAEGEGALQLTSGRSHMSLLSLGTQDFPELPSTEDLTFSTVQGSTLASLFERTLFSMSSDEARPNLNGVLFVHKGDNVLRSVSTDGYRITICERQEEREGLELPTFSGLLIPRKGAIELKRLLEQYPEVELATSENNVVVRTTDCTVHVRLLADQYVPYEEVIPKSNNNAYKIERQPLLNALKRMNLVGEERLHRVSFDFQGAELLIESANANLGKVEERVELLEGSTDHEMQVSFSSVYVLDVLNTIKSETVEMHLGATSTQPVIFKDPTWMQDTFVVVPLRS